MLDDYVRHLAAKGVATATRRCPSGSARSSSSIAEGRSNKESPSSLSLSPTTVETHRAHILQKLDVHNTAELVLFAVRHGVIS